MSESKRNYNPKSVPGVYRALLSPEQVAKAKRLREEEGLSLTVIAQRFSVNRVTLKHAMDKAEVTP